MLIKIVYHSYFHSIINCGIIFWGNSSYSNSVFTLQKRIIWMIMGVRIRALCTEFFFKYQIFYHWSLNIYSLSCSSRLIIKLNFGLILRYIKSIPETIPNSVNHCHIWLSKSSFYFCITVYDSLPSEIKDLSHNIKKFKFSLRAFLHQHSLYALEKYFNSYDIF